MNPAFFVTDLHGHQERYLKLFREVEKNEPAALFIGGDILPHFSGYLSGNFIADFLLPEFRKMKSAMGDRYPAVFIILGNDDPRLEEDHMHEGEKEGLWFYMHNRKMELGNYRIYGYACVPPTPFRFKDWERYDVSRYVDPGCTPPAEGIHTVDTGEDLEFCTIQKDLEKLTGTEDLFRAIILFHSPPYHTGLDRAALDGIEVDHVPLDVYVGSIAIKQLIENRVPWITLHGHVHESTRLTGVWHEKIGNTHAFNAATDQKGLCLIKIPLEDPAASEWIIL